MQRELRQQEDQIYALEDYLQEYQQLLCDARAENAALKRQMVQGQFREGTPSQAPSGSESLPSPPASAPTPPPETTQPDDSAPTPDVPPLDLSTPDVPPLDASSANEPGQIADHAIEQASAEIEVNESEVEVVEAPPTAVVVHGEVQIDVAKADEENSGPRVLLNVEPVDADGKCVAFHGSVSVLVLDAAAPEKQRQLARWDFSPDDLAEVAGEAANGSYVLPLQLPIESPKNRPLELWVRLLPEDGEKLLGRTTMDLSRSGRFASAKVRPAAKRSNQPHRHIAQEASAELPVAVAPRSRLTILDANVEQSGWQTAKPGEVVGRPSSSSTATSEWKLSTRPIPESEPAPLASSTPLVATDKAAASPDRYRVSNAPTWMPNRPHGESAKSPPLDHLVPPPGPAWAPERVTR